MADPWPEFVHADTRLKVIEYLNKKGYSRTEAMLRAESAHTDKEGRPLRPKVDDNKPDKYIKGYGIVARSVTLTINVLTTA
jgi:transcription initiation factor TFIID subunit 5